MWLLTLIIWMLNSLPWLYSGALYRHRWRWSWIVGIPRVNGFPISSWQWGHSGINYLAPRVIRSQRRKPDRFKWIRWYSCIWLHIRIWRRMKYTLPWSRQAIIRWHWETNVLHRYRRPSVVLCWRWPVGGQGWRLLLTMVNLGRIARIIHMGWAILWQACLPMLQMRWCFLHHWNWRSVTSSLATRRRVLVRAWRRRISRHLTIVRQMSGGGYWQLAFWMVLGYRCIAGHYLV